jgi:hypothetical protein
MAPAEMKDPAMQVSRAPNLETNLQFTLPDLLLCEQDTLN